MRMPAQLLPRITISYCSEWEHHTYTVCYVTRRMRVGRGSDVYQQPTATCCNTLQQTACLLLIIPTVATQCNTVQHTACPLLFNLTVAAHTATYCNTLQNTAIHQINLQLTLELQFLGRTISRITWTSLLQPLKQTSPRYNTLQHTHRSKWHFLGAASRQISRQFQLHPMRRLVL